MSKKKLIAAGLALIVVLVIGGLAFQLYRQSQLSHAETLLLQGQYQDLIEHLAPTVEGGGGSERERALLGKSYYRLGQYENAKEVLEPIVQYGNLHPDAVAIEGWIALQEDSPIRAQERFNQLLNMDRESEAEAGLAGVALLRSEGYRNNELEEADSHLLNAQSAGINTAEAYLVKTRLHLYRHQYENAIESAQQAVDMAPRWFEPYLHLGRAYLLQDQNSLAKEAFEKALELEAPEEETKFYLARSLNYETKFEEALEIYQELSQGDGTKKQEALVDQAKIHILLGQDDQAVDCLQEAYALEGRAWIGMQLYQILTRMDRDEEAQEILTNVAGKFPYDPQTQMELANSKLEQNNYFEASNLYKSNFDNNPDNYLALYNIAGIALLRGDSYQAPEDYQAAAQLNPDYFPAQLNHALSLLAVGREVEAQPLLLELDKQFPNNSAILRARALERFLSGYPRLAHEFLEQAKESDGEDASSYIIQGKINLRMFQYEEARTHFQSALVLDPDSASAQIGLAHANYRLGEDESARELYQAVIERAEAIPPHILIQAQNGLAMIHLDNGEVEEANEIWDEIHSQSDLSHQLAVINSTLEFERTPTLDVIEQLESSTMQTQPLPEAYYNLALFHDRLDNAQQAHEAYESLLARFPNYLPGLINFAEWNRERGRLSEAVLYYQKAAEIAPNRADVLTNAASALVERQEFEKAKQYLAKAAELNPNNPSIEFNRALIELSRDNTDQARSHLDTLKSMGAPGDLSALVEGLIQAQNQEWQQAEDTFSGVQSMVGSDAYIVLNQGIAQAKQGNYEEAEPLLKQAVQSNPEIADTHRALGLLYCQMGLFEEAERSLRRSFQLNPSQQDLDAILTQIREWIRD